MPWRPEHGAIGTARVSEWVWVRDRHTEIRTTRRGGGAKRRPTTLLPRATCDRIEGASRRDARRIAQHERGSLGDRALCWDGPSKRTASLRVPQEREERRRSSRPCRTRKEGSISPAWSQHGARSPRLPRSCWATVLASLRDAPSTQAQSAVIPLRPCRLRHSARNRDGDARQRLDTPVLRDQGPGALRPGYERPASPSMVWIATTRSAGSGSMCRRRLYDAVPRIP
jgi:hypothetical protein